MSTNTALDQIKNRVEGHSPTPWAVMDVNDPGEGVNFIDVYSETDGLESVCRLPNPAEYSSREGLQADAELIAAAPKLLAALEAVEALHRKVPVYMTEAGDCKHGMDCEGIEIDGESMCPDETEGYTCDHCAEMNTEECPDWPCSTIKAIEEALR